LGSLRAIVDRQKIAPAFSALTPSVAIATNDPAEQVSPKGKGEARSNPSLTAIQSAENLKNTRDSELNPKSPRSAGFLAKLFELPCSIYAAQRLVF
jgi:hypothetical protein